MIALALFPRVVVMKEPDEARELRVVSIVPMLFFRAPSSVAKGATPMKKEVPSLVTFPFTKSSNNIKAEQAVLVTLPPKPDALVKPTILETHANNRAIMRTTPGQISSHLVYCSSSFFWQHLDGQQEGQTQQQHKKGQINIVIRSPTRNGPANKTHGVTSPVII